MSHNRSELRRGTTRKGVPLTATKYADKIAQVRLYAEGVPERFRNELMEVIRNAEDKQRELLDAALQEQASAQTDLIDARPVLDGLT